MKKYLKWPLYIVTVAMLSAGTISCSDDDDNFNDDELTAQETAIKNIVNDYTANTVIPTYKKLADAAIKLYSACLEMANAGVGNVPTAQVQAAGDAWKEAREYWERSEAWLYGPAGDYDVDPHIDSWPLDQNALVALLKNKNEMAQMDKEGFYISSKDYGLLGFHALEYMLFAIQGTGLNQTSVPHATNYTAEELNYIAGVAGDLRNQCIFLEAAWVGEANISQAKREVLTTLRSAGKYSTYNEILANLKNGLCYANQMKNPQEGSSSDFVNYLAAAQTLITDGIQNIANEVGNVKIGNPTGLGMSDDTTYDPNYIESPYSLNSINDFKGNIISIENAYCGLQSDKDYNDNETDIQPVSHSLSSYVATLDANLDSRVRSAINEAYNAINQMKEPFAYTANPANGYKGVNTKAITACNALNDIFNEVLALLQNQQ